MKIPICTLPLIGDRDREPTEPLHIGIYLHIQYTQNFVEIKMFFLIFLWLLKQDFSAFYRLQLLQILQQLLVMAKHIKWNTSI